MYVMFFSLKMDNIIDIERFIEEVKKKKAIWDSSLEEYRNRLLKKKQWLEVCVAFYPNFENLDAYEKLVIGRELQAKWKHIRDSYVRFLRHKKTKSEQGLKFIKMYVYARQLEFLRAALTQNHTEPSLESAGSEKEDREETTVTEPESSLEGTDNCKYEEEATTIQGWTESSQEVMNNVKRENVEDEFDDEVPSSFIRNQDETESSNVQQTSEYLDSKLHKRRKGNSEAKTENYVNSSYQLNQNFNTDISTGCDDMDFFRSLLPFVKVLPLYQKMKFRTDVMKLALNYCEQLPVSMMAPQASSQYSYQHPHTQKQPKPSSSQSTTCYSRQRLKRHADTSDDQFNSISSHKGFRLLESQGLNEDSESSLQSNSSFTEDNPEPVYLNVK